MSLLNEPFMPVRRRDGSPAWISAAQLSDPEIAAFDTGRPDFNAALAQFAIGLLQTTTPVDSVNAWGKLFHAAPSADILNQWFAPVLTAFQFDGDGARFMQDKSLQPGEGAVCDIAGLLIDSPGENSLKNNSDHFIKRGRVNALCPHCALTALLTLQINAPSGGAGHRTGLRGGGPLSTLVLNEAPYSLWQDLWLNVRERQQFLAQGGDASKTALEYTFPWLTDIAVLQKQDGETAPVQLHPAHVFWAMPRRIRLDIDAVSSGNCDICGRASERLVRQYATKNYGMNYKGPWNHPLTPYYGSQGEWLPMHPQPGGFSYRHWLGLAIGTSTEKKQQRRARVVEHMLEERAGKIRQRLRLWVFGFDMDNMKARCWYEVKLPLYSLAECGRDVQNDVGAEVAVWLDAADTAAYYLRSAVKDAWFGGEARGDFSAIDASFLSSTELPFYAQLKKIIDGSREGRDLDVEKYDLREQWHKLLCQHALRLFDQVFVGAGPVERQHPRRVAGAYQQLKRNCDGPKLRAAAGLPPRDADKPLKPSRKAASAA